MAWPAQNTQSNKFAISLHYLKKEVRDEDNFFVQLVSQFSINWHYFLMGVADIPRELKITTVKCLCNIPRRNWVMKLIFCMLINMKVFYKLIVLFLMGLARHAQITRVNLQYLCVILRKKLGMKLLLQFVMNPMFSHHCPFFKSKCGLALALKVTYIIWRFRAENCPVVAYVIKGE